MPQLPHEQGLSNLLMDLARSMHQAQHAPLVVGPFAVPLAHRERVACSDFMRAAQEAGYTVQHIYNERDHTEQVRALPKVRS